MSANASMTRSDGRFAEAVRRETLVASYEQPIGYDVASTGGVVTTWPSFTGSVEPGLKVVRTTPSLLSRRYVTL